MFLNLIKKIFRVENLERVADVIGFILGLEVVKKNLEEVIAPAAKAKIKEMSKKGNYLEFLESWSKLSEEEQEAIMELLKKMDDHAKRRFIQHAAMTGPTIAETIGLLKSLATKDPDKAAEFIRGVQDLKKPSKFKKTVVGDTSQAAAAWENLINQINHDLH